MVSAMSSSSPFVRAQLGQLADEFDYALAQQRLAAGDADLLDSESGKHARHAQVVGKRQIAVERAFVPRAAVDTLVVAAIGDGDPQIGDGAAEFVGKKHSALSIQHSAKHGSFVSSQTEPFVAEC